MELGVLQLELLDQGLHVAGLVLGVGRGGGGGHGGHALVLDVALHVGAGVGRERHPVVRHEGQRLRDLDEVLAWHLANAAHAAHREGHGGLVLDDQPAEVATAARGGGLDHALHHAAGGRLDVGDQVGDAGLVDDHLAGQVRGERVVGLAEHVAGAQKFLDAAGLDGLAEHVGGVQALVAVRLGVLEDGLEADHGASVAHDLGLGRLNGELLQDHADQGLIGEFFE